MHEQVFRTPSSPAKSRSLYVSACVSHCIFAVVPESDRTGSDSVFNFFPGGAPAKGLLSLCQVRRGILVQQMCGSFPLAVINEVPSSMYGYVFALLSAIEGGL